MEKQLVLIDEQPAEWQIDEHTRDIGLRGVAVARAALADARHRAVHPSHAQAA